MLFDRGPVHPHVWDQMRQQAEQPEQIVLELVCEQVHPVSQNQPSGQKVALRHAQVEVQLNGRKTTEKVAM